MPWLGHTPAWIPSLLDIEPELKKVSCITGDQVRYWTWYSSLSLYLQNSVVWSQAFITVQKNIGMNLMGKGRNPHGFVTVSSKGLTREWQKDKTTLSWYCLLVPHLQDIWNHKRIRLMSFNSPQQSFILWYCLSFWSRLYFLPVIFT